MTRRAATELLESLEEIAQDFAALSPRDRLTLPLDFSDELPDLPERYQGHTELLERVDDDAPYRFGLGEAVSVLRLRGMVAMLGRIKRHVRLKSV